MADIRSAPVYDIEPRSVIAVEHPMSVKNLENGLRTFGKGPAFSRIIRSESGEATIPLYLHHNDPMCGPLLSRNSSTDNLLLKITAPKRTGRKRKRGTGGPFVGDHLDDSEVYQDDINLANIRSRARLDHPTQLLRTLQDNVGRYDVEVVARVDHTHRFRGLADFQQASSNTQSAQKAHQIASGHVEHLREVKLDPSRGWKENEEILPPPVFTIQPLPVNWAWHQHREFKEEPDTGLERPRPVRAFAPHAFRLEHITANAIEVPKESSFEMSTDPQILSLVEELKVAFEERPLWLRRALINRISSHRHSTFVTSALHYIGYQFSSGPFRDCVVKYGVDPRTDNKYYIYQSMTFQALNHEGYDAYSKLEVEKRRASKNATTHLFDGKKLALDGKVWQLCDITDPLLADLIKNAPLRPQYHHHDGYLYNGSWGKIRGIMKVKLLGLLYAIPITNHHLSPALKIADRVSNKQHGNQVHIPFTNFSENEQPIIDRLAQGTTGEHRSSRKRRIRLAKFTEDAGLGSRRKRPYNIKSRGGSATASTSGTAGGDVDVVMPTVERDDQMDDESDMDGTTASEDFEHSRIGFGGGDGADDDEDDDVRDDDD